MAVLVLLSVPAPVQPTSSGSFRRGHRAFQHFLYSSRADIRLGQIYGDLQDSLLYLPRHFVMKGKKPSQMLQL